MYCPLAEKATDSTKSCARDRRVVVVVVVVVVREGIIMISCVQPTPSLPCVPRTWFGTREWRHFPTDQDPIA